MIISLEKIKFQCQGAVQRPKHARVGVRARTQGDLMVGEGVPTRPKWFWVMIFFVTLSPGPCKADINVFSGRLSENGRKSEMKEVTYFTVPRLFLPGL